MRNWNPPELADLLVSELLGSFGDNELSPECLDGAQRLLKPNGVSIPTSYTSYLSPISTNKLWNAVQAFNSSKSFETPYVVLFNNYYELAAPVACFNFTHPKSVCFI